MEENIPLIEVSPALKRALVSGHPWVYRNHVPSGFNAPSGAWVAVRAGGFTVYGLWDAKSAIAVRLFSQRAVPTFAWVSERIEQAYALREPLRQRGTTAYRWVYGESDGLPGIVVDLYDRFAVIATYSESVQVLVPWVEQALRKTTRLDGIVERRRYERERGIQLLWGRLPPEDLVVREYDVRLQANLFVGQKTGLFLDHRENRRFIGELAENRSVLNLFCYTGAFSLYAAKAGAARVVSVDYAGPAIQAARQNFALNQLDPSSYEFVVEDVFSFLEKAKQDGERFDIVICDPPSFAHSRDEAEAATKAYIRLNAAALAVTEIGGLCATASCTSQIGPAAFTEVIVEAARRSRRRFQILHEAGQPLDHPVMAHHPEGRYLKFVVGRVLAQN
jgi:23S rRNA (cytosine1962-C5)-methyltransferase